MLEWLAKAGMATLGLVGMLLIFSTLTLVAAWFALSAHTDPWMAFIGAIGTTMLLGWLMSKVTDTV